MLGGATLVSADFPATVTPTLVPTHPPTPQKDRWRVEEEILKYIERREMKGVGVAGDEAEQDKH